MAEPTQRPTRMLAKQQQRYATGTPTGIEQSLTSSGMSADAWLGPGRPINPVLGYSTDPRAMDYPVGVNIATVSRTAWARTSFQTLKAIIDAYDVARMCIGHKIDELRSMEPLFLPAEGVTGDVDAAVDAARAALEFPDREAPYDEWLAKLLENALRYDALPLYRRRNLNGDVIGLEVLDGPTIAPFIDENGRRPLPPSPAYYQLIHGQIAEWFTSDDITYHRFRPQSDSPYGLAPIESILLTANTDIRFQWHFLQMFTDGSVPAGFIELPPDVASPDQVSEWQDYWDATVMGDQAKLHQLIAVPNGTKIQNSRPESFDSAFPEYLMGRTCAAYGVTPQDIGLVKDVNRANGETQVDIQFRVNTLPWVLWVQGILTRYLRRDLGLPVQVKLDTGRDKEDRLAEAQAWQIYIQSGMASADEGRSELLGLPVDNERPVPRGFFDARQGFIPFSSVLAIAGPTDPETAAPADDVPLSEEPFAGTPGLLPDKLPGGPQFNRAPINPDEPEFPQRERPVPGTDVEAAPDAAVQKEAEHAAFRRFVKARRRDGKWRDFEFTALDMVEAHRLNDAGRAEIRKAAGDLVAAGLCVRAADTGRVLMLQRALDPTDPASGTWEFPGGHIEDNDPMPQNAAWREWQEETGLLLPAASEPFMTSWDASNGVYRGFVMTIASEADVDLTARDQVTNPDDPDGDILEAIAWFDPAHLADNPALRHELANDLDLVLAALPSAGEVAKAGEPDPKGTWRDGPADTPHAQADLPLTDTYSPRIAQALQALWTIEQLQAAAGGESLPAADETDLTHVIQELVIDAFQAGTQAALEQLGHADSAFWSTWEPGHVPAALLTADGEFSDLLAAARVTIEGITETATRLVGDKIADGLLNGDPPAAIARGLRALLGDPSRAERIAHTETARAMSTASMQTYTANGIGEWDLIVSAGACPACEAIAAANPHPVSDGADQPPVHPFCRCAPAPVTG